MSSRFGRVEEKDIQKPRIAHLVVSHKVLRIHIRGHINFKKSLIYSFREVIKSLITYKDMLKRHLGTWL